MSNVPPNDVLVSDLLFPTIVWRNKLTYDNSKLKSYINNLTTSNSGKQLSNYGGWQSKDELYSLPKEFHELQSKIDNSVKQVCHETNMPPLKMDNVWYNVNPPGSYNAIHNHIGCVISGVYYVDVPNDNMGDIEFYRDDDAEYYLGNNESTAFGTAKTIYKSETNVLLLFPSWLKHSVQGNLSTQNRISMSFNYIWS